MCETINISVVVPLYNKEQSVVKTMECILAQTYPPIEVLIINDGSTDNSPSVVEDFIFRNNLQKTWSLIRKPNGGVSSARNRGIQEAKGDYIAFLDADDYWEPDYLQEQSRMIQDFPNAAMWSVRWCKVFNGSTIFLKVPSCFQRGYVNDFWSNAAHSNIFHVSATIYSQKALLEVNGYDERISMGEDLDVTFRLLLANKGVFNPNYLGLHYVEDAENRAMNRTHPLNKTLAYYVDKYEIERRKDAAFRKFFDSTVLGMLIPYINNRIEIRSIKAIVSKLDMRQQKFMNRVLVLSPRLYNLLSRCYQYIRK